MKPRYTNLSSIEPHPDYPLKMYYADEVDVRIAELEQQLRDAIHDRDTAHAELVHLQNASLMGR
jgi:hypothetical protein